MNQALRADDDHDTKLDHLPIITVLISVYNGRSFVEQAVRSMMKQTLTNIEILIVDDGSTDGTLEILSQLAAEDPRIRVVKMEQNVRLPRALNHGLSLARAPLIARMDADDVSHPERLAVQKRYMDLHTNVVAVGSSLRRTREDGRVFQTTVRPRDAFMCRWIMRFRLPFVNPTTMFRHPLPDGTRLTYDPTYPNAEDHDFYGRMMSHGGMVCLSDILLDYRHHPKSLTHSKWLEQTQFSKQICQKIMKQELPADVFTALEPTITAFFDFEPVPPVNLFDGLQRMLAHDTLHAPAYRTWLRRQTAQLAFDTMRRSKRSKKEILFAFLGPGRNLLPSLILRFAEIKSFLPRSLSSQPQL